ncbi:MAG: EamA family transporter, partial [Desulfovibrionaceae bacterium]|nr:EamA family transporter [Desulfovibrionaceae bacterium]
VLFTRAIHESPRFFLPYRREKQYPRRKTIIERASLNQNRIAPSAMACAMGATGLWGLSFVIPVMLPGVAAFDVSLGRYLLYGLLGTILFARQSRFRPRLGRKDMAHALLFAVTGYYGCYTALVWSIDLIGPAVPTLIMGLAPVCVALAGNLRCRDLPYA